MNRAPMQHKQEERPISSADQSEINEALDRADVEDARRFPQTLKEALSFDQQRREAAYQEWLIAREFYQQKQLEETYK